MQTTYPNLDYEAYARLAATLSDALAQFSLILRGCKAADEPEPLNAANDNTEVGLVDESWSGDRMTLQEVQFEFRLKGTQILKLRRFWDFPSPRRRRTKYIFSRPEILRWVGLQPDPQNLASVLRRDRRRFPCDWYPG